MFWKSISFEVNFKSCYRRCILVRVHSLSIKRMFYFP
nr:MAG TPA: hypothetical protein [Caudoviricetes sp.]